MIGGIPGSFMGFGSFQPIQQVERLARNPRTGVPVMIKERKNVKVKVGKRLIQNMNAAKG